MSAIRSARHCRAALLIAAASLASGTASACLPPGMFEKPPGPARKAREAKQAIERAYAVIDAEVVRTGGYDEGPALLYAHRVLKGPRKHWFEVGTNGRDSCARRFGQVGERMRLFVFANETGLYVAETFTDPDYVDRILGSKREADFPYFPGPRR